MKNAAYGSAASVGLLIVYFGILTAVESFDHAVQQFAALWYLMIPLVVGFGVQIGLYFHVRDGLRSSAMGGATGSVASSGGASAGSMILCCLHHVTDVLPLIGLSAAALFLTQFQPFFLLLGIASNAIGITMMMHLMQKVNLHPRTGAFSGLFKWNMEKVRNRVAVASGILLSGVFMLTLLSPVPSGALSGSMDGGAVAVQDQSAGSLSLERSVNSGGGVTIDATPVGFEFGKEVVFDMGLNTHQGSLNYDLTEIATLRDSSGNVYEPLWWDGSPPEGHHRYGKLGFPAIQESGYMELTLRGIYGVDERVFRWDLDGA